MCGVKTYKSHKSISMDQLSPAQSYNSTQQEYSSIEKDHKGARWIRSPERKYLNYMGICVCSGNGYDKRVDNGYNTGGSGGEPNGVAPMFILG